jgi:hypothetical protein
VLVEFVEPSPLGSSSISYIAWAMRVESGAIADQSKLTGDRSYGSWRRRKA